MLKILCIIVFIGIATFQTAESNEEDINPFITGGVRANIGDFPYTVAILINGIGINELCSGVLVKHKWILTAASCVSRENVDITVIFGATDASTRGTNSWKSESIPNSDIKIVESYNSALGTSNIALVKADKMPENIMNTKNVKAAVLPTEEDAKRMENLELVGSSVVITGYGLNAKVNPAVSHTLHSLTTILVPRAVCEVIHNEVWSESNLCLEQVNSRGICKGDTGGPAIVELSQGRHVLAGIANKPRGECSLDWPMLFESVFAHRKWIEETIQQTEKPNGSSIISLSFSLFSFAVAAVLRYFI